MIYVSINSKGGSGKSTFANQILSAYLTIRTGEISQLIEIDDQNNDSAMLVKSDILHAKTIPTSKIKEIDEIFIQEENVIIDVGGNLTAPLFLEEMKKLGALENIIWFIPLSNGLQDNANALDTYHAIKALYVDARIIFVLSNVRNLDDIEWEFLHFFGNSYLDTSMAICHQIDTVQYITIPSSDILNNAKTFMKTVLDISRNEIDFIAKAKSESNKDKRLKFLFLNRVKNEAVQYIEDLKSKTFPALDALLT
jgi:hypothetical protein